MSTIFEMDLIAPPFAVALQVKSVGEGKDGELGKRFRLP